MNGLPAGGKWRAAPFDPFGEFDLELDLLRSRGSGRFDRGGGFYGEIVLHRIAVAMVEGSWTERGIDNRPRRGGTMTFVIAPDGAVVNGRWATDDGQRQGIFTAEPLSLRPWSSLRNVPAWALPDEVAEELHGEALAAAAQAKAEARAAAEAEEAARLAAGEEDPSEAMWNTLMAMYQQQEAAKAEGGDAAEDAAAEGHPPADADTDGAAKPTDPAGDGGDHPAAAG